MRIRIVFNPTSRLIAGWWWSMKRFLVHFRELHLPSSRGTESQTVRAERRIIRNFSTIRWRDQSNTYDLGCDAWTPQRRLLEYGRRPRPIRFVDWIHTIHFIGRDTSKVGTHGPGARLTKTQTTSSRGRGWRKHKRHPGLSTRGQRYGKTCQKQRNEKKNKNGLSRNQSLTTLEDCAVFTSLIQRMTSWKKPLKNVRRKFEVPMQAAMPCKIRERTYKETFRKPDTSKTKYACIVEADESTRKRLEWTLHKDHEDHIAGEGIKSLDRYNPVHKFIPMPKAMKMPDAKAAADKEWDKLER